MSTQACQRLLSLDSGDAALLYLHLLQNRGSPPKRWTRERYEAALQQLLAQGLAQAGSTPAPPPEYSTEDVALALKEYSAFSSLCDEVERRLGKKLNVNELKSLYTLFDHLALPPEVILMLVTWCVQEVARKYGPGRRPFISQIRKEGFLWARQGIDTIEAAERHVDKLSRLRGREQEVLRILNIPPRPLVERERSYIAAWDEMGFQDDALYLAYERTVMKKQAMDWGYMNGILRRWHEKGLHSAAAVRTGDQKPPASRGGVWSAPQPNQEESDRRAREDMERARRLLQKLKEEGTPVPPEHEGG